MNPESIYYLFEAGRKRKQEDYIWPIPGTATENDKVFIVCDGAGSFENGEIASKLICQFMAAKVLKIGKDKMSGELINKLLIEARDRRLITYARQYRLDTDLATTFSMLILYDQKVLISWYGDSRIYHLREGEILFRTEDNSLVSEPIQSDKISRDDNHLHSQHTAIAQGIKADSSPVFAETKWIEDVQDGDYFLLCSKGLIENVTDEDIRFLLRQDDKANIDLAKSFKQLAVEKTADNYSMYLIKINRGRQKGTINNGIIISKEQAVGMVTPRIILAATIIGLLIIFFYFRKARTSESAGVYTNQKTQPVNALRQESDPDTTVESYPWITKPAVKDSVKNNTENPQAAPQIDSPAVIPSYEKPEQTNQTKVSQKKPVTQLLIKLTTDESCKLKIKNIDLDQVIDWDLSQNDNGTIYLKPGKYSIVATSVSDLSKTKTYNFDVDPKNANTTQSLHITF